jgi:hypothetical protein
MKELEMVIQALLVRKEAHEKHLKELELRRRKDSVCHTEISKMEGAIMELESTYRMLVDFYFFQKAPTEA